MNLRAAALALIILVLLAAPGLAVNYKSADGTLTLNAGQIDIHSDKLVATGKAHIRWVDGVRKTVMDADASKMVITIMSEQTTPAANSKNPKAAKSVRTVIKSAALTGPVKMVYVTTDASGKSTITANADNANFDGKANLACLLGNVRIVNDNPALFSSAATMNGDKATINLKPSGPDDFRFRIETSPGNSSISVTPKAQKAE